MKEVKTTIGIKAICLLIGLCTLINGVYYLLVYSNIVNDSVRSIEYAFVFLSLIISAILFFGLWNYKRWAWRLFFITTVISWLYVIFYLLGNYISGMGILYAIIGTLNALAVFFMLKSDVMKKFQADSINSEKLRWVGKILLYLSFYLFVVDLFGFLTALSTSIVIGISHFGTKRLQRSSIGRND